MLRVSLLLCCLLLAATNTFGQEPTMPGGHRDPAKPLPVRPTRLELGIGVGNVGIAAGGALQLPLRSRTFLRIEFRSDKDFSFNEFEPNDAAQVIQLIYGIEERFLFLSLQAGLGGGMLNLHRYEFAGYDPYYNEIYESVVSIASPCFSAHAELRIPLMWKLSLAVQSSWQTTGAESVECTLGLLSFSF